MPRPLGSYSRRAISPTRCPASYLACAAADSSRSAGMWTSSHRRRSHCRKASNFDFERGRTEAALAATVVRRFDDARPAFLFSDMDTPAR